MNQANVLDIVRKFERILIEEEVSYPDAFAAALYIATVSANQMGMPKDVFLKNCGSLLDSDKLAQLKEMQ
jgi:hypothetical protein